MKCGLGSPATQFKSIRFAKQKGRSGPHRRHQGADAQYFHDPLEVVGEYVQAHLGADTFECLGQEMHGSHPELDGSKWVLRSLATHAHLLRFTVEPPLHRLDQLFVLPAPNTPEAQLGALGLDRALLAV